MQISFDELFANNLQIFFTKLVQCVSLCHRLSKKLKKIQKLKTKSWFKTKINLLLEKVFIQAVSIKSPVLDLKKGL